MKHGFAGDNSRAWIAAQDLANNSERFRRAHALVQAMPDTNRLLDEVSSDSPPLGRR